MLPKIKNDSDLKSLLNKKERDDKFTNKTGMQLVKNINEYLQKSLYYLFELYFFTEMYTKYIKGDLSDIISEEYRNIYIERRIDRIFVRLRVSLLKQRRLFFGVKNVIKKNQINNEWKILIEESLKKADSRLSFIFKIIEENLLLSPFYPFIDYLKQNNISLEDFIINHGTFDPLCCDDGLIEYHDEVLEDKIINIIMQNSNTRECAEKQKKYADDYHNLINMRKDKRKEDKENKQKAKEAQIRDDALEALYKHGKQIEKIYCGKFSETTLIKISEKGIFHIIAVVKIFKDHMNPQILYYSNKGLFSSSIKNAKKFYSGEQAKEIISSINKEHPLYVCNSIEVDLRSNTNIAIA